VRKQRPVQRLSTADNSHSHSSRRWAGIAVVSSQRARGATCPARGKRRRRLHRFAAVPDPRWSARPCEVTNSQIHTVNFTRGCTQPRWPTRVSGRLLQSFVLSAVRREGQRCAVQCSAVRGRQHSLIQDQTLHLQCCIHPLLGLSQVQASSCNAFAKRTPDPPSCRGRWRTADVDTR
jgi:hypothetical protein